MQPIISPSIFYWFEIISNLKILLSILFGLSCVGLVFCIVSFIAILVEEELETHTGKIIKKLCKFCTIITSIFGLLSIFIPSKETLMTMIVAKYVTPDNITAVGGTIEESVSSIATEIIRVVEAASDKEDTDSD